MAALPYMQLYVADYLSDTAYLDVIESGAYILLLMNYWQTGKPLPNDDKKLARISRCTEQQWLNVRSTVVGYFTEEEGVLVHGRVERDLANVHKTVGNASKAGKASGAARAKKKAEAGKTAESQRKPNDRSTIVAETLERKSNDRSTVVAETLQRKSNHTDTYTYTDTDTEENQEIPVGTTSENIWDKWINIDTCQNEKKSRAYLGKQIRDYGEDHVAGCLEFLISNKKPIAETQSYFIGILKNTPLEDDRIDC